MTAVTELSDEGLISLHEGIIKALEIDDQSMADKPFNVRGTNDWKRWADILEGEMTKREVEFRKIPW